MEKLIILIKIIAFVVVVAIVLIFWTLKRMLEVYDEWYREQNEEGGVKYGTTNRRKRRTKN